ncbi:MAG: GatB/YqeY domain-containing protein [Leptospira bouyouniensis]|uniref:GatB/YqeY domain-containing protein n=1 Tax=Leptospira bouyouniensis TaxID=2484911 RepID=A0A7I0HPP1_9LEPT|nr:GatB/YqeY domain-containing protein [Leptospira bouyouniensis]TGK48153.1 GatB/YqeY domain-containing protein [Leptospira bouyouniensis]TGL04123.1 GatB/YqeY domain-containing protein [Leptospira bouyouniensis]TGM80536.1 GatB/YqeY domain-containing protein [Leptospira bouyouniensis]
MTLQETINTDLKTALKAKDEIVLGTLRLIKAEIQYELTKTGASELSDTAVMQILKTNYKRRKDTALEYDKANRPDLSSKEIEEAEIISRYIPKEVSEEEIGKATEEAIVELNAGGPQDMGKVMGKVMAKFKGQNIDGSKVSSLVKQALSAR